MKKTAKAPSDATLLRLWRLAVRWDWDDRCALFGQSPCFGQLECHHLIRRARLLTRYERNNGILLCQAHHRYAETMEGKRVVGSAIIAKKGLAMVRISELEKKLAKDWFAECGYSRAEYLSNCATRLRDLGGKP